MRYLVLALLAAPVLTYGIYRLAKGLGFLDPPWNREHEERRTIVAALFAFVLFFSIFLFGYANSWPRVWAVFGIINGLALAVFAGAGAAAAWRLWKLRHHPAPTALAAPPAGAVEDENPAGKPLA